MARRRALRTVGVEAASRPLLQKGSSPARSGQDVGPGEGAMSVRIEAGSKGRGVGEGARTRREPAAEGQRWVAGGPARGGPRPSPTGSCGGLTDWMRR